MLGRSVATDLDFYDGLHRTLSDLIKRSIVCFERITDYLVAFGWRSLYLLRLSCRNQKEYEDHPAAPASQQRTSQHDVHEFFLQTNGSPKSLHRPCLKYFVAEGFQRRRRIPYMQSAFPTSILY